MLQAIAVFMLTLFTSLAAHAADCDSQATDKKLSGAAKASFLRKCVSTDCGTQAEAKKLAGAAKTSFTNKCIADGLASHCDEQAANRKLAGAAKTSFLKKCQLGK